MKYSEVYQKLKQNQKIAFIPFTMLGFPDFDRSLSIIKSIIDNGADILELGLPFSDPVADGPIIQEANTVALNHGINTESCLKLLKKIREYSDIPLGLLVYGNLIYSYGIEKFYKTLGEMNINSVLIPDVPVEEIDEFLEEGKKNHVESVFIITPITPQDRMKKIITKTSGFIYLMSRLGVTGTHQQARRDLATVIAKIKSMTSLPVNDF
jgi:tryptophan synthase alpha chain